MQLFRNPEIKRNLICFSCLALAVSTVAFIWKIAFGVYTLAVCLAFIGVYLIIMHGRYRKIAKLSEKSPGVLIYCATA